jgi:hypothetical protein
VSIGIAIVVLSYFIILVMAYMISTYLNENAERGCFIINRAYQNAYSILLFGILIVMTLIELPHITIDSKTTSYLILASKFLSVLTLGVSIFILSKSK